MRRVIHHSLVGVLLLLPVGCASAAAGGGERVELTTIGEAVQVTENTESTQECEFITDLPLVSQSPSDANAIRALRNSAGDVGANLVLLVMETRTTLARAEGYLCAD